MRNNFFKKHPQKLMITSLVFLMFLQSGCTIIALILLGSAKSKFSLTESAGTTSYSDLPINLVVPKAALGKNGLYDLYPVAEK
jgi:hypothetical protein